MAPSRVSVLRSPAVKEGRAVLKVVNGVPVLLVRVNGVVRGYVGVCPHRFYGICTQELEEGKRIVCPGHGERFDAESGAPLRGIAPGPLSPVKVVEEDGKIYIEADFDELSAALRAQTGK